MKSREATAAINIQSFWRRYQATKAYGIKHLPDHSMTNHRTFVVGNDPVLPSLNNYRVHNEKFALLATSGLRAVEIACKVGDGFYTPKVIIIDTSLKVYHFWNALRAMMQDSERSASEELFFIHLPVFLKNNKDLYRKIIAEGLLETVSRNVAYPNQDITTYFVTLFAIHGYDYVRDIISHVSLIKQTWSDKNTISKLIKILEYHEIDKIGVYVSNIAQEIFSRNPQDLIPFLKCIEAIEPSFSIQSDYCHEHTVPENIFITTNSTARNLFGFFQRSIDCVDEKIEEEQLSLGL